MPGVIRYSSDVSEVDWQMLKQTLQADRFDNGRTADQLRQSVENSAVICFAFDGERIVGTARALSDGVCNAYVVDVWTLSSYRRRGIATRMMESLLSELNGQHVYLFTDEAGPFYRSLGFKEQPAGFGMVMGTWLEREG